jgi:TetR/AcrR family transcriptional repressor of nem operon
MKVTRDQVQEHRRRILDAAARMFREKGFDGVGVAEIMNAAGLTHGAFYGHFKSKQDLAVQAFAHAVAGSDEAWTRAGEMAPGGGLGVAAGAYLTPDHRGRTGEGCPFAALATDVARRGGAAQKIFAEGLKAQIDRFTPLASASSEAGRRAQAITAWAGMIGAMVLARAAGDPALSDEILATVAASLDGPSVDRRD